MAYIALSTEDRNVRGTDKVSTLHVVYNPVERIKNYQVI